MSKLILMLCLLTILAVAISSVDSLSLDDQLEEMGMISRVKRGPICWGDMVKKCCKHKCQGAGCRYFMCSVCC